MTLRFCHLGIVVITLVVLLGHCGCDETRARVAVATSRPVTGPVGEVKGTILFTGVPPQPVVIMGMTCHSGAHDSTVDSVIVGPNHELAAAVVSLDGITGATPTSGDPPGVLNQVNCQYSPSVVALHTGQTLHVMSHDATIHNVHSLSVDNPSFNKGMNGSGQSFDVSFQKPETFQIRCDVHPWMVASVYVFDHPYFAVTDKHGSFVIQNVPVGRQMLKCRHAFLGELEIVATVEEGKSVEVTGTFEKADK